MDRISGKIQIEKQNNNNSKFTSEYFLKKILLYNKHYESIHYFFQLE